MSLLERLEAKKKDNGAQEDESLTGGEVLTQAIQNIPSSAGQLVSDITMPIRHPIMTAQSLASLGRGIYQLTTPGEQPDEATAKAVGKFFADRYGTFEGFKKSFAQDPLGILSDISVVFTGGAAAAAKVPGVAGRTTATISKVGDVIDPVLGGAKLIGATAKGVGNVATPLLGLTTGAGADAISTAVKAGASGPEAQKLFLENMRGQVSPDEIVPKALQAMKDLSGQKTKDFKSSKKQLALESTPIVFTKITDKIADFEKSKMFEGMSELSAKAQDKLNNIKKIVAEFEANPKLHNAKGLDILKRRIDAEYPTGINVGDAGMVVTDIRNSIKSQILKEVPEYGKVMKDYELAINLEKQFRSELSLGRNANAGTTLRKLQSAMRNNVNTSYGNRLNMLNMLDPSLVTEIGGQALNAITPRGLQGLTAGAMAGYGGFFNPAALAGLPLQSPRLVGETAFKIGQLQKSLQPLKSRTALQTARSARLFGEFQRATDTDDQAELLRLLLKNPDLEDSTESFKSNEINDLKGDALQLKDQFGDDDDDTDVLSLAEGGDVSMTANNIVNDVLLLYRSAFSPEELQTEPLKKQVMSMLRIENDLENPKFQDQIYKEIQTYRNRLQADMRKSNSNEMDSLKKMQNLLDQSLNKNIEDGFATGDEMIIDQLKYAPNLYQNFVDFNNEDDAIDTKEKIANKILQQIENNDYTPKNVVNLMFAHKQFAPNQTMPTLINKLQSTLPEDKFVDVKDILKDGIISKAFSVSKQQSNIAENFSNVMNGQKEIVDALFSPIEVARLKGFKKNVLPGLNKEIKDNPENINNIMISALAKKDLLNFAKPIADDSSLDIARQTLQRFQEPLVTKDPSLEIDVDEGLQLEAMPMQMPIENIDPQMGSQNLQTSISNFAMPSIEQPLFAQPRSELSLPQIISPTILPDELDREIAMRKSGIAGLV